MELVNKINILSTANLYWLQDAAVDFISKLFIVSHCHSVTEKFFNLVKLYLKSAFMAFEIMALIIGQALQHGIHKCNTLITLGVSCEVKKRKLNVSCLIILNSKESDIGHQRKSMLILP